MFATTHNQQQSATIPPPLSSSSSSSHQFTSSSRLSIDLAVTESDNIISSEVIVTSRLPAAGAATATTEKEAVIRGEEEKKSSSVVAAGGSPFTARNKHHRSPTTIILCIDHKHWERRPLFILFQNYYTSSVAVDVFNAGTAFNDEREVVKEEESAAMKKQKDEEKRTKETAQQALINAIEWTEESIWTEVISMKRLMKNAHFENDACQWRAIELTDEVSAMIFAAGGLAGKTILRFRLFQPSPLWTEHRLENFLVIGSSPLFQDQGKAKRKSGGIMITPPAASS